MNMHSINEAAHLYSSNTREMLGKKLFGDGLRKSLNEHGVIQQTIATVVIVVSSTFTFTYTCVNAVEHTQQVCCKLTSTFITHQPHNKNQSYLNKAMSLTKMDTQFIKEKPKEYSPNV